MVFTPIELASRNSYSRLHESFIYYGTEPFQEITKVCSYAVCSYIIHARTPTHAQAP